jgi:hypothetical protein
MMVSGLLSLLAGFGDGGTVCARAVDISNHEEIAVEFDTGAESPSRFASAAKQAR